MRPLSARREQIDDRKNNVVKWRDQEDDSSRWEVPHYSHPEKNGLEENRTEKAVSSSRSLHTRVRLRFAISRKNREPVPRETRRALAQKKRNDGSFTGNCSVDIVPDPVTRNHSPHDFDEAAAYYFHFSGRFGKLSLSRFAINYVCPRCFENNKSLIKTIWELCQAKLLSSSCSFVPAGKT